MASFQCLGPFLTGSPGQSRSVTPGRRSRLLAALVAHVNTVLSIDQVIGEIWEQDAPAGAAQTVHAHVARLRKDLASHLSGVEARIDWRHPGYVLHTDRAEVDICVFSDLAGDCAEAWPRNPLRAIESGRQALALWRGIPFAGHELGTLGRITRARLEETHLATLETVMDAKLELGLHRQLIGELRELVLAHPFYERFHVQLMIALYRCQRQSEALDAYHSVRRLLQSELGVEPSPQLRETATRVLRQDPVLRAPATSAPVHMMTTWPA
ncbi:BTAD domain-containing putative transcriptional regulator [Catellatospora coxensis]|uniref:DNA-binding SARP family transcriptional activator n=1 Tax=Catellatospora coxensis TaxID=310354 RepID=A0A8J3P7J2_9ACTN|nr:AfsR/SARP family transcriptional regulator [Catellatospora coxensis]GIG07141.1 hypothetical protein Cco03nite_38410 [Catellatospora coxensis]